MTIDTDALRDWLRALQGLSHYQLLGVPAWASFDDIQRAFHRFAEVFHPDVHVARPLSEQRSITQIFQHGTEAYRVLSTPELRARYDAAQRSSSTPPRNPTPPPRPSAAPSVTATPSRPPPSARRLSDRVRAPSARPFAARAEELAERGDLRQAKLQLVLARHHDPDNEALETYLRHIEAQLEDLKR